MPIIINILFCTTHPIQKQFKIHFLKYPITGSGEVEGEEIISQLFSNVNKSSGNENENMPET